MPKQSKGPVTSTSHRKFSRERAGLEPWTKVPNVRIDVRIHHSVHRALKDRANLEHKSLAHLLESILNEEMARYLLLKNKRRDCCVQCRSIAVPVGKMCGCPCHREAA